MSKAQSAFKSLYTELFTQGGDFKQLGQNLKKPLKVYVKESFPNFLISDGYFFLPVYFTKEAISEFRSKYNNI